MHDLIESRMSKLSLCCCFILLALLFTNTHGDCEADKVGVYELKRGNFSLKFSNFGATMLSAILPDKNGELADVVLGFDSLRDYKNDSTYFGAIVGRVANRIAGAQFDLNGIHYQLVNNEGNNMLHGGRRGFSQRIWRVESHKEDSHITFTCDSYDGEQGFPGDLAVSVTYMFIGTNKLGVKMEAKALDVATPVNLALHTYWNLGGHNSGSILSHKIQIFGSNITPVDDHLIPTGKIVPVKGTPYDFLQPREIGSRFKELADGYDMNYVLDNQSTRHLKKVAVLSESVSGRKLELWTNQPGVQFYTSNMLGKQMEKVKGKDGFVYSNYAGLCLESQGFPNSVNQPNFPSQIVNPGQTYHHFMLYRFTAN